MKRQILSGMMTLSILAGVPILTGCDRTVKSTSTEHTNPDGTVTKSTKTVDQTPNGGTETKTSNSTTPNPAH
jgi:hypothetical protein